MPRVRNWQDFFAAAFFLAFAAAALFFSRGLPMGTADAMGPRYAPAILAGVLAIFGLLLMFESFVGLRTRVERGRILPVLVIPFSFAIFGATIESLGLFLSVALTAFAGGLAGGRAPVVKLAIFSLALAAMCSVMFVLLLRLPYSIWPG
jgi:hypothetical protein